MHTTNEHIHTEIFYFIHANISSKFRSKTKYIQLAALAKATDMKKYGANVILKPIMEDIKKLVSVCVLVCICVCMCMHVRVRVCVSNKKLFITIGQGYTLFSLMVCLKRDGVLSSWFLLTALPVMHWGVSKKGLLPTVVVGTVLQHLMK